MNEIQVFKSPEIQKHNFDKYKEDLKKFSENTNKDFIIPKVVEDSWFFFDHKVTGDELNEVTRKITNHLIDLNKSQNELIEEFRVIYNTFDSLDKDYISGILTSIKSAEIEFDNSVYDLNKAIYAIEELQKAQKDIVSTVDIQKRLINGFVNFQERLNKYKHLDDVDKIWDDTQRLNVSLYNLKDKILKLEKAKDKVISKIEYLEKGIQDENTENKKYIEKVICLVENIQKNVGSAVEDQKVLANNINNLLARVDRNSHFDEIDVMWKNSQTMENMINDLSNKFVDLKEEQNNLLSKNEELIKLIENKKDESQKIRKLSIAVTISFIFIIINFAVNYLG